MKKAFLIFLIVFSLTLSANICLAIEPIDLAKVDYRYNALLEFFLQLTREKKYEQAYGYMAGNFPKKYDLNYFIKIIEATGLAAFTEKKWTFFEDKMKEIGVTTVKGEFTTPNGVIHGLTFFIILGGETEIKIGGISEILKIADLPKLFPQNSELNKLLWKDLLNITRFIRKKQAKKAYGYLSAAAKTRIKFRDVSKAFSQFRKLKLNVRLPKNKKIVVAEGFTSLSPEGVVIVEGSYENKRNLMRFTLGYDYEDWQWKLGLFSLNAKPLTADSAQ